MPRLNINKFYLMILLMAIVISGCNFENLTKKEKVVYTTFKTLQTAKLFRTTGLEIAGKLHSEGLLTDKVAMEIITVANDLQASINAVTIVLKAYYEAGEGADKTNLSQTILVYERVYVQFSNLIMPYLIKRIGV